MGGGGVRSVGVSAKAQLISHQQLFVIFTKTFLDRKIGSRSGSGWHKVSVLLQSKKIHPIKPPCELCCSAIHRFAGHRLTSLQLLCKKLQIREVTLLLRNNTTIILNIPWLGELRISSRILWMSFHLERALHLQMYLGKFGTQFAAKEKNRWYVELPDLS